MRILLASASPRRRELLGHLGIAFECWSADVDETPRDGEKPADFCRRLSNDKARAALTVPDCDIIIAADTIVVVDDLILGKPENAEQAAQYLKLLCGRRHEVMTAYTIIDTTAAKSTTNLVVTEVFFTNMTEAEISWYVASGEPMDKAGAYAIQGIGGLFISKIEGSHSNVIGLPLAELHADLKALGIEPAIPNREVA